MFNVNDFVRFENDVPRKRIANGEVVAELTPGGTARITKVRNTGSAGRWYVLEAGYPGKGTISASEKELTLLPTVTELPRPPRRKKKRKPVTEEGDSVTTTKVETDATDHITKGGDAEEGQANVPPFSE